jgi:hypothetical protein
VNSAHFTSVKELSSWCEVSGEHGSIGMIAPLWLWTALFCILWWYITISVLFGELLVCILTLCPCRGAMVAAALSFFCKPKRATAQFYWKAQGFMLWCAPDQTRRRFDIGTLHISLVLWVNSFDWGLTVLRCPLSFVRHSHFIMSVVYVSFTHKPLGNVMGIQFSEGARGHMPLGRSKGASSFISSANSLT